MVEHLLNPESKNESTATSQSTSALSALDLLREGSVLNGKSSNDSGNKHLRPVDIVGVEPKPADAKVEPAKPFPGAVPARADGKNDSPHDEGVTKVDPPKADSRETIDLDPKPPVVTDNKVPNEYLPSFPGYAATTERLSASGIAEAAYYVFDRVDSIDKNGFLSKEELAKAVEDGSYKGQEVQVINALYRNVGMLESLNKDELFFETSGIARGDMAKFDTLAEKNEADVSAFSNASGWTNVRFENFDTDGSKSLSWDEVGAALENKNLDAWDQNILTYLKSNFGEVADENNDGEWIWQSKEISPKDMSEQKDKLDYQGDSAWKIGEMNYTISRTLHAQKSDVSRELFADQTNPENSITPEAITQGFTGNCYLLASIAAVAKTEPELIFDMIAANSDGTYTVTFPGDVSHPVTVEAPTTSELGLFNEGSSEGIWASVLEKSYGKYVKTYRGQQGLTDIEAAGNGGNPRDAMKLLTGRDDFDWKSVGSFSTDSITQLLLSNFEEGHEKPMTVATSTSPLDLLFAGPRTEDGFFKRHAYTITGVESDGTGDYMVTIRNPWGRGEDSTYGTKTISIAEFQKNFTDIFFEMKS